MKNSKIILWAVFALAASVCLTQAQTLLVRFPLNDTSGGNTFAADTNGQANAITYPGFALQAFTTNSLAADFQSSLGEGVSGLGYALDFSTNLIFDRHVLEGGAGVAGPIAQETNNTALNFGFVSSFTATIWFKANQHMPYTNAGAADGGATGDWDLGPRIFILGPAGTTDKAVANSIGLFWQQWNDLAFDIGTSEVALPCYTNPVDATGNAFVPTNQWIFFAATYDGNNTATFYLGTDQTNVTQVLQTSSITNTLSAAQLTAVGAFVGADALAGTPQGVGPGSAGMPVNGIPVALNLSGISGPCALFLGNRPGDARPFTGWLNDFRFYSGSSTPNNVEDIRWSAVAPVNLAFTVNGMNQPVLTWNALGGAASYIIYSRTNEIGSFAQVGTSSTLTYTDTVAVTGNTYQYVVAAVDTAGDATTSANSQSITVPLSPAPPPSVPVVTPTAGTNQVTLNWPASTGSGPSAVAVYNVARSTVSGQEVVINTVTAPTTTYNDTNLFNGLEYFYEVNAVSVSGSASAYSTEVNSTPLGPPLAPNATAATAQLNIVVNWTDPNPPSVQAADSYIILCSTNGNLPYFQIGTTGIGVLSFTNTGLTVGETYSYEVEATNSGGTSVPSSPTPAITVSQQVILEDIAEQTVRAAADHNGVVNDNGSGTVPGYGAANSVTFLRVKWVNDGNPAGAGTNGVPVAGDQTSCAKTYLRWSLVGQAHPDTNSDLTLTWTTATAGVPTTMTLWSLNQAYQFLTGVPQPPGDGSTFVEPGSAVSGVTWDNAQANDTNYDPHAFTGSFQMLTNGAFTATPIAYFTPTAQNTAPAPVVVIPAPWGNLIHGNELVFCVGGTNNASTQASAGYRIANHTPALVYNQVLGVNPPSISVLTNITLDVYQTSSTVTENFTVTDPDFGNANGVSNGVAVVLSDTTGGTTAMVSGGPGGNQSVTVTPGHTPGTASIEVTIVDEHGDSAQRTFTLTVLPPLVMSTPPPTNTLSSAAVAVPFTVVINSLATQGQLTMTATVDAQSTNVLASASATYVSGNTWKVTVTPVAGTNGIGLVDLSATDPNSFTASAAFAVMVQPSQQVVFSDIFNYTPASSLVLEDGSAFGTPPTVNDGIWNEIGPVGPVLTVNNNSLNLAVAGNGEEAYANLLNGPYAPGHGYVIYTTFQGDWSTFTGFTWLGLGAFPGAGGFQYAGLGNVPDALADGGFNVTIVNGPGGAGVSVPETLATGTNYNIAIRYDVDLAKATLWVNATNETDPHGTNVTATDVQAPSQISDVTLNQNGAAGQATVVVNDLTVTVVNKPVVTSISVVGSNVQIVFTAGVNDTTSSFFVNSTTNLLTTPFSAASPTITSLGGGSFKATLPVSANQTFYLLGRTPYAFSY